MPRKIVVSMGTRITFLVVCAVVLLSAILIYFSYQTYKQAADRHFQARGRNLVRSARHLVETDRVQSYLESGVQDEDYEWTLNALRVLVQENDAAYIYVFIPDKEGLNFVFDTGPRSETDNRQLSLGSHVNWDAHYSFMAQDYMEGKDIPSIVLDTDYGWVYIIYAPLFNSSGKFVAYLGADFSMEDVIADHHNYLKGIISIAALVGLLIAVVILFLVRRNLVGPINRMAAASHYYLSSERTGNSFSELDIQTHDELELLQDSLKAMEKETKEYIKGLHEANHKAEVDPLTSLYNRGAFERRVEDALLLLDKQREPDAFVMIDFDKFKNINDVHGHGKGDEALVALAKLLTSAFRSGDIVARMGGDEFAVYCISVGSQEKLAQRIDALSKKWRNTIFESAQGNFSSTLSIGIALAPRDGATYKQLYENADTALYASKEGGRDAYTFFPKGSPEVTESFFGKATND